MKLSVRVRIIIEALLLILVSVGAYLFSYVNVGGLSTFGNWRFSYSRFLIIVFIYFIIRFITWAIKTLKERG